MTHPAHLTLTTYVAIRSFAVASVHRLRQEERGEGVISAAIAILIMAFLGVAMWLAFKGVFDDVKGKTEEQITEIGN